jgi:hypothetical protein
MPRAIRVLLMILGIVLVVAILLVIAMPKFDERPIHAYRARMLSDLTALRTMEEDFYRDSGRYTAALRGRFRPSSGLGFPQVVVTDGGWSATSKWNRVPGVECGVAVNIPNPVHKTDDGAVWCTPIPYIH